MGECAKYIAMHRIVERQTLKIMPVGRTVEFIAQRMYDCYAVVKDQAVVDVELGVLAHVIDVKKEPGSWHEIKPVEFVPARYAVEDFYKPEVM